MPPRKRAGTGPTPVESIHHTDKRVNLPTADAEVFVAPEVAVVKRLRWERDPSLDPQLVWRGKDDVADELFADAPPIYIQEKIDPQVLVENLRQTATAGGDEPEATLFDMFDGLDELDLVDFYRHGANWSNRMILGDSLQVMASLTDRESLRGKVQMIYLDPPYGIKFGSNWQVSTRNRDVKDGKVEDAAREAEQIKAFRDTWENGIGSYLTYLRDRLIVARDLLTESGSVFVQIGDENVHVVRNLLDEVFGPESFCSLITVQKTGGASSPSARTTVLPALTDYVLWYAKQTNDAVKYRQLWKVASRAAEAGYRWIQLEDGSHRGLTVGELRGEAPIPVGARLYKPDNIQSGGSAGEQPFTYGDKTYRPAKNAHWKASMDGMERLALAKRIHVASNSIQYVRFADDFSHRPLSNIWTDTGTGNFTESKLYVVQTNSKVIERCMLMTTDPGDLVLDPTCGSGTTAYVAEEWGRRWITIDTSRVALALARQRLMSSRFAYYLLADSDDGRLKEAEITGKTLPVAQYQKDVRRGFVLERAPRVTLGSIARNPDIREGMTREQIDAAIARHADVELLYDKPYEDKKTVRVTGPFTVESLSPHRSLSFSPEAEITRDRETISEHSAALDPEGPTFEQTILDNLVRAGVQNGRRAERIEFATLDAHAGTYLQAIGDRRAPESEDDVAESPSRIAVAIGPQYGTVSPSFIKAAAKEAINTEGVDLLCVLGFAFDPTALHVTEEDGVTVEASEEGFASVAGSRRLGRIPVLFVRMNADLLMGEDLKKTGAGNLFTVFGEPDIEIRDADGGRVVVEIRGVDVYDPTTGEVRSGGTDQIALWMIDTRYNGESFFVRHCYFTGGNDPLKRLKAALKADIDAAAWEALYRTESMPFERPDTGRIAVKVINDYGDEVMKVFDVSHAG
jgi:adenine-specific DNA-methyltransferase